MKADGKVYCTYTRILPFYLKRGNSSFFIILGETRSNGKQIIQWGGWLDREDRITEPRKNHRTGFW